MNTIAWLVKKCPNFYYAPSLFYDRIFLEYGDVDDKRLPAYWLSRGYPITELVESSYEECEWVIFAYKNKSCIFSTGVTARRELGKEYLNKQKASKQLYDDVIFVKERTI